MINLIWAAMILIGLLTALLTGHMEDVNSGIIASGEEAVTLCITMLGIVTMWSGIMKIAERTGLMKKWSKKNVACHEIFVSRCSTGQSRL